MSELSNQNRSGCGCASFRPGHNAHSIQAHQANSDPTSWFAGSVAEITGDEISVRYDDDTVCRLWRHGGVGGRLQIGDRVVVCEAWSLLALRRDGAGAQLSVEVRGQTWRKHGLPEGRPRVERTGIVSNETGEGIDLYHGKL
jgi:hypothetical protein